jgi:urease accessory protein UreE
VSGISLFHVGQPVRVRLEKGAKRTHPGRVLVARADGSIRVVVCETAWMDIAKKDVRALVSVLHVVGKAGGQ